MSGRAVNLLGSSGLDDVPGIHDELSRKTSASIMGHHDHRHPTTCLKPADQRIGAAVGPTGRFARWSPLARRKLIAGGDVAEAHRVTVGIWISGLTDVPLSGTSTNSTNWSMNLWRWPPPSNSSPQRKPARSTMSPARPYTPTVRRIGFFARFDHPDLSNEPTENLNLNLKIRIACGFRDPFDRYRLRVLRGPRTHPRLPTRDTDPEPADPAWLHTPAFPNGGAHAHLHSNADRSQTEVTARTCPLLVERLEILASALPIFTGRSDLFDGGICPSLRIAPAYMRLLDTPSFFWVGDGLDCRRYIAGGDGCGP